MVLASNITFSPKEDTQFGYTAGGLFALERDHGFISTLAALPNLPRHSLVDL